jgi:hypothetical protein
MQSLPNELLAQIASHLADQPPSVTKFHHEPSTQLTYSNSTSLKALSQVSWKWRKVVLPILFQYARIALDKEPQWVPMDARLVDSMQEELSKLSNHEFMLYTKLRSKFKSTSGAFEPAMDDVLIQLCRIQDGDDFLKSTPRIVWLPHLPKDFADFTHFVTQYELKRHIKSVVVHTDKEYNLRHVATAQEPLQRSVSTIWTQILSFLEPTRVVVAAPPQTMAALLDSAVGSNDSWAFEMKMHYIELVQNQQQTPSGNNENKPHSSDSPLILRRPWYHIGYNEGSSITVYSTYEFHLKIAPRILEILLTRLSKRPGTCLHLTSFSFIAVFPLSAGVTSLMRAIHAIPSIEKVSFQLAPGPDNDLLSNASKRRKAQSSDFWFEWRLGYKVLADMESFMRGQSEEERCKCPAVREIVSRDCYTKQLAVEVTEVVEHGLKMQRVGWRGDGVGRWVRDVQEEEDITRGLGGVEL